MKWIGQYIFDFAIRIRNKLYDASGSSGSPPSSTIVDYSGSDTGYAKTLTTDGDTISWVNATWIHDQGAASDTWTINHNLNRYPSVTVVDSSENVIIGTVNYSSPNQVIISFFKDDDTGLAFDGKAYLN